MRRYSLSGTTCRNTLIEHTSHQYRVLFHPFAKTVSTTFSPRGSCLITFIGLNSFVEPNFLVYEVHYPRLDKALAKFRSMLSFGVEEDFLVTRCREGRMSRIRLSEERVEEMVCGCSFPETIYTDIVLDLACSRNCSGGIHSLALWHLRYSMFTDFGQERFANICSTCEIFSRKVLRQSPVFGMCLPAVFLGSASSIKYYYTAICKRNRCRQCVTSDGLSSSTLKEL